MRKMWYKFWFFVYTFQKFMQIEPIGPINLIRRAYLYPVFPAHISWAAYIAIMTPPRVQTAGTR